jgi:hypothetical protein
LVEGFGNKLTTGIEDGDVDSLLWNERLQLALILLPNALFAL